MNTRRPYSVHPSRGSRGARRLAYALGIIVLLGHGLALGADWAVAASQADSQALIEVMHQASAADAVYRNALYLYLRLAGVVWVAVEWGAAILLWRGYRLLLSALRNWEGQP